MMQGINCPTGEMAAAVSTECFNRGLVIETSGSEDQVVKCLCPLTITESELDEGLHVIGEAVKQVVTTQYRKAS